MTTPETYNDDRPIFDWSDYGPAKSWREPEPIKFTPREGVKLAIMGIGLFVGGMAFLVLIFCM